mmetsp:Transcript_32647/g.45522  ORF Transcript_32647/g.45522 Transcript_32647/m.45522 type:complete len:93 (+) Transcript_32647:76-354(+)
MLGAAKSLPCEHAATAPSVDAILLRLFCCHIGRQSAGQSVVRRSIAALDWVTQMLATTAKGIYNTTRIAKSSPAERGIRRTKQRVLELHAVQ